MKTNRIIEDKFKGVLAKTGLAVVLILGLAVSTARAERLLTEEDALKILM